MYLLRRFTCKEDIPRLRESLVCLGYARMILLISMNGFVSESVVESFSFCKMRESKDLRKVLW